MLFGTCDDLSIPRPLGPIRDLVGSVSDALGEALSAGAAPARHPDAADRGARAPAATDRARARGRALGGQCDSRFDHRARAADRLASGAARAHVPRRRGATGPSAARSPRCDQRRGFGVSRARAPVGERRRLARRRRRATTSMRRPEGTRSTSTSCSRREPPPSCRPRSRTPCSDGPSRLDDACAAASSSWSRSCRAASRTSLLDAVMPDWAEAAEEPERRQLLEVDPAYVRFRHELARNAIRSSIPIAARRRLHAEILAGAAGRGRRSGRHRPPRRSGGRRGRRRRVRARRRAPGGGAGLEPRGVLPLPARRPSSSIGYPPREQATVLEELAMAAYAVGRLDDAFAGDRARHRRSTGHLGDEEAVGRCTRVLSRLHWFAGDGDAARSDGARGDRDPRAARRVGRAGARLQRVSQLAMLAEDAEPALAWGERALELADQARRRAHARARARQHRHAPG